MSPEMVVQMPLESQPLTPYSTERMESQRLKKKQSWWTYRQWLFS
ncbi:hypothetical protein [Candidatus Paraluminiphilus aquimaris]|nr:hypothetical protein [Candidatus Paraluminiphilus aquimaris]